MVMKKSAGSTRSVSRNLKRVHNTNGRVSTAASRRAGVSRGGGGQRSDKDLILVLHKHFRNMKLSNVQGFHVMDSDDNELISAADMLKTYKEAGVGIGLNRAKDLMKGYCAEGKENEMDIPGFIRLMASAYTYEDEDK